MSESNPKTALDAVLDDVKKDGEKQEGYPLTLGRYALLELLESPVTSGESSLRPLDMIPTLYVMTHGMEDLRGYTSKNVDQLRAASMDWAEGVELSRFAPLVEQVVRSINLANRLAGGGSEEPSKKN